ncbi:zinc transporter [Sulfitobacter sp. HNIBRBA3233]|uniref:ZIP family metal transporter n=1 Tax=Sulfitobacter marinivivus TaxID=3158558 RepID=UPI0032E03FF1
MLITLLILATTLALVLGAVWGLYGPFPAHVEGFMVALAGGALIVSVVAELLEPAARDAPLWIVLSGFAAGAGVFTLVDIWLDRHADGSSGKGLLAAVVLDGIPENLALGVVLVSSDAKGVLALAASIFLSNLPEAAGGAREMTGKGHSRLKVLGLWSLTAMVLSASALAGYALLSPAQITLIAVVQSFAAGAVVSSLATEVFPTAYREDHKATGFAVALGVALAFGLHQFGG